MLQAILSVKFGLKRNNACCKDYPLPSSALNLVENMEASTSKNTEICTEDTFNDEEENIELYLIKL